MTRTHPILLATLLAAASTWSMAQTAPAPTASPAATAQATQPDGTRAQRWAERRAQRQEQLTAALKLSPAQEGAWSTYTAAMQPPAQRPARMDRAEMAQLTTPQRIERMQAVQAERQQFMNQRLHAVKAFYAQLTPEQQKVYDQQSLRRGDGYGYGHGPRMHGGPGMHRGG